jgi:hypothetical protein
MMLMSVPRLPRDHLIHSAPPKTATTWQARLRSSCLELYCDRSLIAKKVRRKKDAGVKIQ